GFRLRSRSGDGARAAECPVDDAGVAEAMAQLTFETADRIEVLRCPRVLVRSRRVRREHGGDDVGELDDGSGCECARRLAAHDAGPRSTPRAGQPDVLRVPAERL